MVNLHAGPARPSVRGWWRGSRWHEDWCLPLEGRWLPPGLVVVDAAATCFLFFSFLFSCYVLLCSSRRDSSKPSVRTTQNRKQGKPRKEASLYRTCWKRRKSSKLFWINEETMAITGWFFVFSRFETEDLCDLDIHIREIWRWDHLFGYCRFSFSSTRRWLELDTAWKWGFFLRSRPGWDMNVYSAWQRVLHTQSMHRRWWQQTKLEMGSLIIACRWVSARATSE